MPKLSKIRLTGCKYDGLRKEHENSVIKMVKQIIPYLHYLMVEERSNDAAYFSAVTT